MKTRKRVEPANAAKIIRRGFVSPQEFYTPSEAATVLGWTLSEVERAIEEGTVEVTREGSGTRIAWRPPC